MVDNRRGCKPPIEVKQYIEPRRGERKNMASSLVKIDIHLIFHVKTTSVNIKEDDLNRVFAYIGGIIKTIEGIPFCVGGRPDHIHILTSLPKSMTIVDFVRTIKINSSKWIKTIDEKYRNFAWQDGYGAFSVSPSLLDKTMNYIKNQEEHHKKRAFQEEYKMFLDAYGVEYDEKYFVAD